MYPSGRTKLRLSWVIYLCRKITSTHQLLDHSFSLFVTVLAQSHGRISILYGFDNVLVERE